MKQSADLKDESRLSNKLEAEKMSQCLYFYRVSRITDDLPEIINTDRMSFPYYDVRPDDAADWEKEIGMLRTIEYGFMDIYEAGEKLFGERPLNVRPSQSYYSNP